MPEALWEIDMKRWIVTVFACMMIMPAVTQAAGSFVTFESGQVRPLALSADGTRLYSVNTPDNRLEIYNVDATGLTYLASVPVGMEPVAVAEESASRVWVLLMQVIPTLMVFPMTVTAVRWWPMPLRLTRTTMA